VTAAAFAEHVRRSQHHQDILLAAVIGAAAELHLAVDEDAERGREVVPGNNDLAGSEVDRCQPRRQPGDDIRFNAAEQRRVCKCEGHGASCNRDRGANFL
jgi:hypothetical protein